MACYHNSNGTDSVSLVNAKIIVEQHSANGLTKMELQHLYINVRETYNSTSYWTGWTYYENQYDPSHWAGGSFSYYYQATMKIDNSSYTAYSTLYNQSDGTYPTNGEITTTSVANAYVIGTSSVPDMPTSAKEMSVSIKSSNAAHPMTIEGSSLVIDVSNLQIPENLLLFLPILFFLPKIMESLKKRQKLRLAMRQCNIVNSKAVYCARKKAPRPRSLPPDPG